MCKFRAVSEADRQEIDAWIAADPGHAGKMTADFFLTPGQRSLYAIEDDKGTVGYICQEAEAHKVRMHLQFCPDKRRVLRTFQEAYKVIVSDAKSRGFDGIVFASESPALVKFMMNEFGFSAECKAVL